MTKHAARLETVAKAVLSPTVARLAKKFAAHPRYLQQRYQCGQGMPIMGIATRIRLSLWLVCPKVAPPGWNQMLASYPGFHTLMHPDAVVYESMTGGSHDYDLSPTFFKNCKTCWL
ncbi:MAG: hypothetical protein R3E79_05505 [Caldilineaceae bacterium]